MPGRSTDDGAMDDGAMDDEPMDDGRFEGPGPHPLIGRQTLLVRVLRALSLAAWCLAGAGVLLPGRAGMASAVTLVSLLVAAPVARVGWLCVRWMRRGDPRYAAVAACLVLIVLSGGLLAA
jgi:hypothetical protein